MESDVGNAGERMVSGSNNWGYYAHLSIYRFFSDHIKGKRILEIGSGTGYGANYLSQFAKQIVSLDVSEQANAFCRAHSASDSIEFRLHDLSKAPLPDEPFEALVSSNAMEHIAAIDEFLANCTRSLKPDAVFWIAVPPVTDPGGYAGNFQNPFHVNNLTPGNWVAKLLRYFEHVDCYRHWVSPAFEGADGMPVGMSLPPSETVIREGDFAFEPQTAAQLNSNNHCITAVFAVRGPRQVFGAPSLDEELPREWHVGQLCATVMVGEVAKKQAELDWYKTEYHRNKDFAETASRSLALLNEEKRALVAERDDAIARLAQIDVRYSAALERISALEASTSWRLTAPLRSVVKAVRGS